MPASKIRTELEALCRRYDVEIVYAFGSRAQEIRDLVEGKIPEPCSSSSDADLGVRLRSGASLAVREKVRLGIELEDLLGVDRVDLCVLQEADPFVAANVVRGERIYCEDAYRADEYDLYVLRRAGDLAYLERERQRLILGEAPAGK